MNTADLVTSTCSKCRGREWYVDEAGQTRDCDCVPLIPWKERYVPPPPYVPERQPLFQDPHFWGQDFWRMLGRKTIPNRLWKWETRWYHWPWIKLAWLADDIHQWHEFRFGGTSYTSIEFCRWPVCWLLYRIKEIALMGRY